MTLVCLHLYGNIIHNTDEECCEIWTEVEGRPSVIVSISTSIPLTVCTGLWLIYENFACSWRKRICTEVTTNQSLSFYCFNLQKNSLQHYSCLSFPIILTQFIIFQTNTILKPTGVAPSSWTNSPFIRRKIKHLRRLESFGTKSLDVRNTFFRHCLVNTLKIKTISRWGFHSKSWDKEG